MTQAGDSRERLARIAKNVHAVRERIAAACARARRDPADVRLVAVTKTRPLDEVLELFRCGETHFAENRVQDALDRIPSLGDIAPEWHFVGRLQTNKAKYLPAHFAWIHSVDRADLAEALGKAYAKAGRRAHVFVQANVSGEASKAGMGDVAAVAAIIRAAAAQPALTVAGLMTMAPFELEPGATRPVFRALRELRDRVAEGTGMALPSLSMGMSNDFEYAIEEGATHIRVGTALFE